MEIEIISFGKIAEFLVNQRIASNDIENTDQLQKHLENSFPLLANMKYKVAVNRTIIQENTQLKNNDSVAIMPPFSGG